jgi:hypothetical protein
MKDERKSSLIVLQADMTIEEIKVLIEEIQRVSEYMGIKLTFKQQKQLVDPNDKEIGWSGVGSPTGTLALSGSVRINSSKQKEL